MALGLQDALPAKNYVATYGALITVWTLIHRAHATMLNYVVHTGLFCLVTNADFALESCSLGKSMNTLLYRYR